MDRALLSACCFAAGCAPVEEAVTSAITNGTRDEGDPAVVALTFDGTNISCTGTLVSPRVVLTAGHCAPFTLPKIFFGTDPAEGGLLIDSIHVLRHPDFGGPPPIANDLAMILLAEPAPETISPIGLYPTSFDPAILDRAIRIVGFGSTAGPMPTVGIKREGIAKFLDYTETSFRLTGNPAQTCAGDSGGPAFVAVDGVEYLAGVTSSGDPACAQFGRSTRVDPYANDFILPFLRSTEPGAAQLGERCYYQAQCTTGLCITAIDDPRIQYCSEPCTNGACREGQQCDNANNLCRYPFPTPGAFGSPCEVNGECVDGTCARPAADASGTCSLTCTAENPTVCPDGYACVSDVGPKPRHACFVEEPRGCNAASGSGTLWLCCIAIFAARARRRPQ